MSIGGKEKSARTDERKNQTVVFDTSQTKVFDNNVEKGIEELEQRMMSQIEARVQAMEKKCKKLEEILEKVFNISNTVSE